MRYLAALFFLLSVSSLQSQSGPDDRQKEILSTLMQWRTLKVSFDREKYKKEDFNNPQITERILQLLKNEYTAAEAEYFFREDMKTLEERRNAEAKEICKWRSCDHKKIIDSLYLADSIETKQKYLKERYYITTLPKLIGYFYLTDFSPVLISLLSSNEISNSDKAEIRLALARMQINPYYNDLLKDISFDKKDLKGDVFLDLFKSFEEAEYINTQDSYYAVTSWLKCRHLENIIKCTVCNDMPGIPLSYVAVERLSFKISNFPLRDSLYYVKSMKMKVNINDAEFYDNGTIPQKDIDKLIEWSEENKENMLLYLKDKLYICLYTGWFILMIYLT